MRRLAPLTPLFLALAACQSSPPPRPSGSARVTPSATAASLQTASVKPPEAVPQDPIAAVRARGVLHGEPIRIPATARTPERWLAFLGTAELARSAWLVTPGVDARPVDGWPAGARIVGSVVREAVVYLLLETVAILDQPAGLRAVWFESFGSPLPLSPGPQARLSGVRDVAELARRIDSPDAVASAEPPVDGALLAVLKVAAKSEAATAAALAGGGADVYDVWQSAYARLSDHIDAARVASSQRGQELLAMVRDAVKNDHCDGDTCEVPTTRGTASIRFVEESGRWVIKSVVQEAPTTRTSLAVAPHAVPPSATTVATEQVLREQVRTVREILGEAPLVSPGAAMRGDPQATIGVAITDLEYKAVPTIAIRDGAYARVFPLSSMALFAAKSGEARFDVRFADVDGDGRTDVVVRGSGKGADGSPQILTRVFLSPAPSVQAQEAQVDYASELALLSAPTLDDAVQAAIRVPTRGISAQDACALLKGAGTLQTFRKIGTADVKVLTFEEPEMPTYRATVVPEPKLAAPDVKRTGEHCPDLECNPTRPYCANGDGYSEYYWFSWVNSQVRLAGAAFYNGP